MKKYLLIVLLLLTMACNETPVKTENTNNPNVQASLLFEKDGYKVYRFSDAGRNVYYVVPEGRVSHYENCGKSCARLVETQTVKPSTSPTPEVKLYIK